jgi:DNA-binding transcriptional MerR regulator
MSELRIGEVAKLTATTPRTIRYYEEIGLLPTAAGRESGSHRSYQEEDVERLTELLRLKDLLGVSLDELKDLTTAEDARAALRKEWKGGVEDPVRRRQILDESLGHISKQLHLVRRRRDEIAKLESELLARRKRINALQREGTPDSSAR